MILESLPKIPILSQNIHSNDFLLLCILDIKLVQFSS